MTPRHSVPWKLLRTPTQALYNDKKKTYRFMCRSYALTRPRSLWLFRTLTSTCVFPRTALYNKLKGPDLRSFAAGASVSGVLMVTIKWMMWSVVLLLLRVMNLLECRRAAVGGKSDDSQSKIRVCLPSTVCTGTVPVCLYISTYCRLPVQQCV